MGTIQRTNISQGTKRTKGKYGIKSKLWELFAQSHFVGEYEPCEYKQQQKGNLLYMFIHI